MSEQKKTYPFRKAILKDFNRDLSKRWHLEFYVWSERKAKLIRRRWYKGFDEFTTVESRLEYGRAMRTKLNNILPKSCIDKIEETGPVKTNKPQITAVNKSLTELLRKILEDLYKPNSITYRNYKSSLESFIKWLDDTGKHNANFENFTKKSAQEYVDFLNRKGFSPSTVYNRLTRVKSLANKLIEREYIETNPFAKVVLPKKVETERNSSYSETQIKQIKKHCLENEPFMWLICKFIYYTYMRPVEIGRLKLKHLDLENNKIHVSGEISKNAKSQAIELPEDLKIDLEKYIGEVSALENYLFTASECPGSKRISKGYFGKHFLKIRRDLGLHEKHTLYSWKHTGVVQAYKNGVDIKAIQIQCRHASIDQTDTYLKSLGFMDNTAFIDGVKRI